MPGSNHSARSTKRTAILVFGLFAAIYSLSTSGTYLGNADSVFMYGVAGSLALSGTLSISDEAQDLQPPKGAYTHLKGTDGRLYFPKGMSYSALLVPFYLLGHWLVMIDGASPDPATHAGVTMFTSSLAGAVLGAAECALIFLTVVALGFSRRVGVATAVIAGVSTILWPSSKSNFAEPLMGLMITSAYYGSIRYAQTNAIRWLVATGSCLAVLFLSQPIMLVLVVPVFTVYLAKVAISTHRASLRRAAIVAIGYLGPIGAGVVVLAWLDIVRYGSVTSTGYWTPGIMIPLYVGGYGLLLSPGKSLLLYSPTILFSLVGLRNFTRRVGFLGTMPLVLLGVFVASYGSLAIWSGDGAWGPRYLIPLTGMLCIAVAGFLEAKSETVLRVLATWALLICGALVQIVGVATSTAAYFSLLLNNGVIAGNVDTTPWRPTLFDPEFSPIVGRAELLISALHRHLLGASLSWTVTGHDSGKSLSLPLAGYDVVWWWPTLLASPGSFIAPRAVTAIVGLLLVLGAVGLYCGWKLGQTSTVRPSRSWPAPGDQALNKGNSDSSSLANPPSAR